MVMYSTLGLGVVLRLTVVVGTVSGAALGYFTVGQFTVKKKTEPNIFSYGEVSYGEKSTHAQGLMVSLSYNYLRGGLGSHQHRPQRIVGGLHRQGLE